MLAYRHPDAIQRRLWGVAANLAVLAGWMSHDVGLEPTAQKYFLIAAHAAREGGDRPLAPARRCPAPPARWCTWAAPTRLPRPDETGPRRAGAEILPRTQAMLHTIEAWAQAALGRGQAMRRTLGEAEDLFVAHRNDEALPNWMQTFKDE